MGLGEIIAQNFKDKDNIKTQFSGKDDIVQYYLIFQEKIVAEHTETRIFKRAINDSWIWGHPNTVWGTTKWGDRRGAWTFITGTPVND